MLHAGGLFEQNYIRSYWNKDPVVTATPEFDIGTFPDIEELIGSFSGRFSDGVWHKPSSININASRLDEAGLQNMSMNIDISSAQRFYSDQYSLCFGDLSEEFDAFRTLKTEASEIFGHPDLIAVTGYLSPPAAVGVLHFDRQHNFFFQKQGSKRWFVSAKAAVENPYENLVFPGVPQSFFDDMKSRGYEIALPRECGRITFELNPGDVLYVPPGFYHAPETLDSPSLHYTLTVEPLCFFKGISKIVFDKLLSSGGKFMKDQRFITDSEIAVLTEECITSVLNDDVRLELSSSLSV